MSLRERIETTEHAVQWWLEKPILGIGLGTFWEKQKNFSSKITLHNTPLWLLTEMGLVGFLLFVWFFVKARRVILTKTQECAEDFLAQGMLIVFPAFLVSSLTTEIFYQRYLWFFLGLVLAHKASVKVAVPAVHTDFKQNLKSLSIQT